jgi:hypothetical protein
MANHGGKRENAGRKSLSDEVKGFTLAQPHVQDAFRVLSEIMLDEEKRPSDRIASAKILIEYGCGKPKETVDTNLTVSNFNIKDVVNFKQ